MADLIGVVHLPRLKAHSEHKLPEIIEFAVSQAVLLDELGYDGIIVENFGDGPFAKTEVDDTVLTKLAIICHEVRKEIGCELGLNILRNATVQAMKVASVLELDFIRANIWEGAYVTDQGIIEGTAYATNHIKENLHSSVDVYADIFVKHATPLADFSLEEAAEQAMGRGGADRVIISGRHTGDEIDFSALDILNAKGIKPMIGSGFRHEVVSQYQDKISGAIVGTAIKETDVTSPISIDKAKSLQKLWLQHFL